MSKEPYVEIEYDAEYEYVHMMNHILPYKIFVISELRCLLIVVRGDSTKYKVENKLKIYFEFIRANPVYTEQRRPATTHNQHIINSLKKVTGVVIVF